MTVEHPAHQGHTARIVLNYIPKEQKEIENK